ncbi:MAG TPA: squalene/phytoene synthase family protein [Polyangiaceae bacterium]
MGFARFVRSSDVRALADDARKDDENIGFVAELPLAQQAEWLARFRWLRMADRLAENEMIEPGDRRFSAFRDEWRSLVACAHVDGEHAEVWREMRATWWTPQGTVREPMAVACYGRYLEALRVYTRRGLVLRTLGDHDAMLRGISGNGVCVFPYVREEHRDAAARFGMLDQLMNNLRDIAEDASHGLCYFPRDVLGRFGVEAETLLDASVVGKPGYQAMMRFWLDEHLASIRQGAAAFGALPGLHPSLVALRLSAVARHARIERVFRSCGLDPVAFVSAYWEKTVTSAAS